MEKGDNVIFWTVVVVTPMLYNDLVLCVWSWSGRSLTSTTSSSEDQNVLNKVLLHRVLR